MIVPDNGHLRRADLHLPVYRCRMCDLFFLNPPPPAELGRRYFADAYSAERSTNTYYDDGFKGRTSAVRLDEIESRARAKGSLLDVGCGKGHFVAAARSRGWIAWGVELDAGACQQALTRFNLDTIRHGSLEHPDLPSRFDVITLWDVIEHVPDPLQTLRDAWARLEQSGLLVIRTANIRSSRFDRDQHRWWAFGCDHRFYFSPRSMAAVLRAANFRVIDILNLEPKERPEKGAARRPERPLDDRLRALLQSPRKILHLPRYCRTSVRLWRGSLRHGEHYHTSIMTVVARKLS